MGYPAAVELPYPFLGMTIPAARREDRGRSHPAEEEP